MMDPQTIEELASSHFRLLKQRSVFSELSWGKGPGVPYIPSYNFMQLHTEAIHLLCGELRDLFRTAMAHKGDGNRERVHSQSCTIRLHNKRESLRNHCEGTCVLVVLV